ncbi:sterigmatocystin 8-O-methyltransferase precursor [Lindgomyces ingoldianus]|uniref:Sterigmatocystin 8-O-methyltransferase n=1 Tax=Lindgomyces ingoldianus TaxID=673940 RepID=A0ACB6QPF5_9PLEO|nr:sterigmatocystin 8-O-methyltransferase precursor [Lindgomyces ingoldianus]KAF2468415.1 sterigmatocystin 8-O-methyltransferase precursor [Lindgomyces ingoldianus]
MVSTTRIAALAKEIEAQTTKLDKFFAESQMPPPSFDEDAPSMYPFPPDVAEAQEALLEAVDELWWLHQGPIQTIVAKSVSTSVGLKTILKYNIQNLVPFETGTTFNELAEKTGIPEKKLTRLLRHGITEHFFRETQPGHIKHTAATKALAVMPALATWSEMGMYDVGPAKTRIVDAIAKWPDSDEPNHSGFQIANDTDKAMFDFFEDHPARMNRFKDAMSFLQKFPGLEPSYTVKAYDWASLGKATVVDIGGSHGLVSIALAKEFPDLQFVVQDLLKVIEDAKTKAPAELSDRLIFQAHNFFEEQPVKNADIYFFRWILHDWSDKYCIKIIRALIPALKPGARLLFSERCLEPPCTLPLRAEKWNRDSDITMLATSNSQERDEDDWKALFKAADSNITLEEVRRTPGAKLDLIVARWK